MQKTITTLLLVFTINIIFSQDYFPTNDGISFNNSNYTLFTNAKIYSSDKNIIEDGSMLIKNGKIIAVGKSVEIPKNSIIINLNGKSIYPSFIDIYSKYRISNFTQEYWLGWYGTKKSRYFETELKDQLFELAVSDENFTVSLNYTNCSDAKVQIIMSPKLVCNNNGLVVNYSDLVNFGIVLVFCQKSSCYAKFGQEPIWKIKE
jgi:hypothetical protein